jgi:hypothetical protein
VEHPLEPRIDLAGVVPARRQLDGTRDIEREPALIGEPPGPRSDASEVLAQRHLDARVRCAVVLGRHVARRLVARAEAADEREIARFDLTLSIVIRQLHAVDPHERGAPPALLRERLEHLAEPRCRVRRRAHLREPRVHGRPVLGVRAIVHHGDGSLRPRMGRDVGVPLRDLRGQPQRRAPRLLPSSTITQVRDGLLGRWIPGASGEASIGAWDDDRAACAEVTGLDHTALVALP